MKPTEISPAKPLEGILKKSTVQKSADVLVIETQEKVETIAQKENTPPTKTVEIKEQRTLHDCWSEYHLQESQKRAVERKLKFNTIEQSNDKENSHVTILSGDKADDNIVIRLRNQDSNKQANYHSEPTPDDVRMSDYNTVEAIQADSSQQERPIVTFLENQKEDKDKKT